MTEKEISPVSVEKDKLFGAWSEDEIGSYKEIIDTVIFLKQARKSPDLAQYILESSKRFSNAQSNLKSKTASRKFPLSRNQIKQNAKIISHKQENQSQHNKDKSKSR